MLRGVPPDDADLVEACGEDPRLVCEAVWENTDNRVLAAMADWLIGVPLTVLAILAVAWLLARYARRLVRRSIFGLVAVDRDAARLRQTITAGSATTVAEDPRRTARATSIATVVASTITVLVWVVALLLVVGELGVNLAPLIAGAGIAGVAIGFGAQNLVKDCVSGLFMLIEDQYGIGDSVDLGVATGGVERITLRATVLRGADGTVWHVPNGEIRRVGNRSKLWSNAVLDVVVAYDADLDRAAAVIQAAAESVCDDEDFAGDVLAAPEVLGVESVAPDGVALRLVVKTGPGAQFRLQRALRQAIKVALDAAGVEVLPVPARAAPEPQQAADPARP